LGGRARIDEGLGVGGRGETVGGGECAGGHGGWERESVAGFGGRETDVVVQRGSIVRVAERREERI
jgi:hypothetical protein